MTYRQTKEEKADCTRRAEKYLKDIFKGKKRAVVKCVLNKVSRSGMQREITFLVAHKGEIVNINWSICQVMSYRMGKTGGLIVKGCGMDMGFHVVNNLSMRLYCPKKYEHNAAYKLNSEWVN